MNRAELLKIATTLDIKGRHDMNKNQLEEAIQFAQQEESVEKISDNIVNETPAETIDETPAETIDETPAKTIDETPAETIDETPAKTINETPAKTTFVEDAFPSRFDVFIPTKRQVKEVVRRYPSLGKRDNTGHIIRRGKNLSGNSPFRRKYYYLNPILANRANWTDSYVTAYNAAPPQVRGILNAMANYCAKPQHSYLGREIVNIAKERGFIVSKIDSDKLFAYYRRALELLGVIHNVGFYITESEIETQKDGDEEDGDE